ncbi:MAG: hydantoinase/oxoprolinase family protein [Planctomycetaceae bacterium]
MRPLGLDIGGANLKASDGEFRSVSVPFAVWREPEKLSIALRGIVGEFQSSTALAVTMTGELADCFATKAEGVRHILSAVETAAKGIPVAVWTTGGEFVSTDDARELVPLVAAANWHALATWAARSVPTGCGLLIDIGSTTTDIIPLSGGIPVPEGRTDLQRLQSGELVYTGVRRTPVCAVTSHVPLNGVQCPLSAELFATMLDVYLILGDIREVPSERDTANGRPATIPSACDRLARMLCADVTEVTFAELASISRSIANSQESQLRSAVNAVHQRLPGECELVIVSGEGGFLAEQMLQGLPDYQQIPRLSLAESLGPEHSQAACAYSLARLARERPIS